jgi:exopolysaccharide biosynthesis protein
VDDKSFKVAIIAADLNSTKVIVDSASDGDCRDNCPVMSLADYVLRNGAFAGINGGYFCPADYPSCAGKTNSFDTLIMNKNKTYFNSDNNVYSTVPAAIFMSGGARFVEQSLEWGRDSGVDGVIANYPLLVRGGNVNFTENSNEPKFGGAAARTFIAAKGNMVYIGIVYGASMGESAKVLQTLGMSEALNLDQGGSTALWSGGYKAGPGRGIPNAILFVKR